MRTEVRANRPVDEDHMALCQCCWPLIKGDLGPLWVMGKVMPTVLGVGPTMDQPSPRR